MKEINLQQILFNTAKGSHAILTSNEIVVVKIAMLEAIKQALELAAENAVVDVIDHEEWKVTNLPGYERNTMEIILPVYGVDESSILDTIDQVK